MFIDFYKKKGMEVRQLSTNLVFTLKLNSKKNMSLKELKLKKSKILQFSLSKTSKKCFPTSCFYLESILNS